MQLIPELVIMQLTFSQLFIFHVSPYTWPNQYCILHIVSDSRLTESCFQRQ